MIISLTKSAHERRTRRDKHFCLRKIWTDRIKVWKNKRQCLGKRNGVCDRRDQRSDPDAKGHVGDFWIGACLPRVNAKGVVRA